MRLKTTCLCESVSCAFDVSLKMPRVDLESENSVAKKKGKKEFPT